jgi:hypothetical protein
MYGYPGIGLLRVEFDGVLYTGTASLIANGKYLLTSAHNVVDYYPISSSFWWPTSAWFELRNNTPGETFDMMKARYKVTNVAVYPRYFEDPTSYSRFDLTLCSIEVPEFDRFVQDLYRIRIICTCPALWPEHTPPLEQQWLDSLLNIRVKVGYGSRDSPKREDKLER